MITAILFSQSQPEYSDTDRKLVIVFGLLLFYILQLAASTQGGVNPTTGIHLVNRVELFK